MSDVLFHYLRSLEMLLRNKLLLSLPKYRTIASIVEEDTSVQLKGTSCTSCPPGETSQIGK